METIIEDKIRVRGLHNLFDLTTEFNRALFFATQQGCFTKDLFLPDVDATEETVIYIICDETDEFVLGAPYINESTWILTQGLLLNCNNIDDVNCGPYYVRRCGKWVKIRPISISELEILFSDWDNAYYSYYDNNMNGDLGLVVGVGTFDDLTD